MILLACLVNVRLEAGQRYSPREAAARPNRLFQGSAGTVPEIALPDLTFLVTEEVERRGGERLRTRAAPCEFSRSSRGT